MIVLNVCIFVSEKQLQVTFLENTVIAIKPLVTEIISRSVKLDIKVYANCPSTPRKAYDYFSEANVYFSVIICS